MIYARCEKPWQAKRVKDDIAGPMPHDILPDITVERPVYVWEDFDGFTVEVGPERVVS